jgi:putative heme iron utilization protein
MKQEELALIAALVRGQRTCALATLGADGPFVSFAAYAAEPDFGGFLLHLSGLAVHTRNLQRDSRAALLIAEPDDGRADPQTLPRITLAGAAARISADDPGLAAARSRYQAHLPASAMLFELPDFALYRLVPDGARYVGGFARAYTLTVDDLRQAAGL